MFAILKKELIGILKSPRSFVVMALLLLILSFALWTIWPRVPGAVTLKSQIAIQFFRLGSTGLFVLLSLFIPIFCAPSISQEHERHCMELLITCPLKPSMILLGKLISSVMYLLLLLVSSLPVMGLCFLMGGVDFFTILAIYLIISVYLVTFAQISLICSCFLSKTYGALTISYIIIMPIVFVLSYLLLFRDMARSCLDSLFFLVPLNAVLFWIASRKIAHADPFFQSEKEEKHLLDSIFVFDRTVFPDKILAPLPPAEVPDGMNVVYWKEVYYELLGQGTFTLRLLILSTVLISLPMAFFMFAVDETIYAVFLATAILLITPAIGGGSFTHERENGTHEILFTTPLPFHAIFWGKTKAVLRLSCVMLLLLSVPLFVACLSNRIGFLAFLQYMLLTLSLTVFLAMLSLFISLLSPSTFHSMAINYLLAFVLFVLPLLFFLLLTMIPELRQPSFLDRCGTFSLFSPFAALLRIRVPRFMDNSISHLWMVWQTVLAYLIGSMSIWGLVLFKKR